MEVCQLTMSITRCQRRAACARPARCAAAEAMAVSTRRDLRLAVARRGDAAVHAHSITSITSIRALVITASLAADATAVREEAAAPSGPEKRRLTDVDTPAPRGP